MWVQGFALCPRRVGTCMAGTACATALAAGAEGAVQGTRGSLWAASGMCALPVCAGVCAAARGDAGARVGWRCAGWCLGWPASVRGIGGVQGLPRVRVLECAGRRRGCEVCGGSGAVQGLPECYCSVCAGMSCPGNCVACLPPSALPPRGTDPVPAAALRMPLQPCAFQVRLREGGLGLGRSPAGSFGSGLTSAGICGEAEKG
jgi:hypothetical protein